MKKAILILATIALGYSQFNTNNLRAHFGLVLQTTTMFEFGADYKLLNFNPEMPFYGNLNFSFGSESAVSFTAFEFGATTHYLMTKQKLPNLYFSGGLLVSIVTGSFDVPSNPFFPSGSRSTTETDVTFHLGTGYKITPNFFTEVMFAITGFDNVRLRVGYNF